MQISQQCIPLPLFGCWRWHGTARQFSPAAALLCYLIVRPALLQPGNANVQPSMACLRLLLRLPDAYPRAAVPGYRVPVFFALNFSPLFLSTRIHSCNLDRAGPDPGICLWTTKLAGRHITNQIFNIGQCLRDRKICWAQIYPLP